MSLIDRAIAANRKRDRHNDPWPTNKPAPKVAILTCMDPHLNELLQWLDIKPADADVIRNVGTAATEDVVRPLMFSIHVLGVREVIEAAMNVTDDAEGSVLGLLVVPKWMTFDCDVFNLFRARLKTESNSRALWQVGE